VAACCSEEEFDDCVLMGVLDDCGSMGLLGDYGSLMRLAGIGIWISMEENA